MYIIRKTTTNSSIIYMEYDDKSYPISNPTNYNIFNICVYDTKFVPKVNNMLPFDYVFNDLANTIFNYLYVNSSDDDDDDGTTDLLLGELEMVRNTLESKYKEFIKRQEYYMYLDKLTFFRDELLNRREINKYRANINNIISSKSR